MRILHFVVPLIAITSAIASPLLDLKAIAGKSQKEVQAVLGAPDATEKTKYGPKLNYKGDTIEVVFIQGKADWITFTPKEIVPFTKDSLSVLGLPPKEPTFSNANVIRWEPSGSFVSVSMFPGASPNRLDYFYVKIATK